MADGEPGAAEHEEVETMNTTDRVTITKAPAGSKSVTHGGATQQELSKIRSGKAGGKRR